MMTCSRRDGVVDCGMAGRVQNARQVAPGWGSFLSLHTQSQERSCTCQQQADEGRSEPLTRCTDGGVPMRRGGSHVHEVFCHVSHSGRYIRAPTAKVHCACTILRLLRPGTSHSDLSTRRALALVKPQL